MEKLEDGVVNLLHAQADWQDDEYLMHVLGYVDGLPAEKHDSDQLTKPEHHAGMAAAKVLANVVARIVASIQ